MQYLHYIDFIYYGSRLFVMVCIVYLFLRKGRLKTRLHPWIVAANNLFLIIAIPTGIAYIIDAFTAMSSGDEYENYAFMNRVTGPYWWAYWLMIFNTAVLPNLFWFKRVRHAAWAMPIYFIPYYIEQYVIMLTSLHRDYLPTTWQMHFPFHIDVINLLLYTALLTATYYIIQWHQKRKYKPLVDSIS